MSREILEETSEGLVEPEVAPPEASYEVSEPFVGHFVRDDGGYEDLVLQVSVLFVVQQISFPVK